MAKKSKKGIAAIAAGATLAGVSAFLGFTSGIGGSDLQTGYHLNNPLAIEDDIQKTIVAPDGHKFSVALDELAIQKLESISKKTPEITSEIKSLQVEIASAVKELGLNITNNPY